MWNEPTPEQLERLPRLYETEHIPLQEKLVYMKFFLAGCTWWVMEYDGADLFFGFVVLNNDLQMSEFGYISFSELKEVRMNGAFEVDRDLHWKVRPAIEVETICKAQGWNKEEYYAKNRELSDPEGNLRADDGSRKAQQGA